ncbi:hypothetical protein GCM10010965_14620 [Caldalkalibacillus thermarum]|nr:hypothetical protein GCM10010965_14620 [Caldalkalibacillus thermarum]
MHVICKTHGRLRCWECSYIEELREENERLREALIEIEKETAKIIGNDIKSIPADIVLRWNSLARVAIARGGY